MLWLGTGSRRPKPRSAVSDQALNTHRFASGTTVSNTFVLFIIAVKVDATRFHPDPLVRVERSETATPWPRTRCALPFTCVLCVRASYFRDDG